MLSLGLRRLFRVFGVVLSVRPQESDFLGRRHPATTFLRVWLTGIPSRKRKTQRPVLNLPWVLYGRKQCAPNDRCRELNHPRQPFPSTSRESAGLLALLHHVARPAGRRRRPLRPRHRIDQRSGIAKCSEPAGGAMWL